MKKARFEAELIEGHKGVVAALVPFDPEKEWALKPVRLVGRRDGWPIEGEVNGIPFQGYVGNRWGRFFVMLDQELRNDAEVEAGDTVRLEVAPSFSKEALARATAQSKVTTQPKKARPDALEPEAWLGKRR